MERAVIQLKTKALNLRKEGVFAGVSHELRTPLNGIIGLTEMLMAELVDTEHAEALKAVHGSASKLAALVEDLLQMSALKGEGKLKLRALDLSAVVREVMARLRNGKDAKSGEAYLKPGVSLVNDMQEMVLIRADKAKMCVIDSEMRSNKPCQTNSNHLIK
jgi:signal transduction histidine kinase